MQGQSFVLVPEGWLNEINAKLDQLLERSADEQEYPGPTLTAAEAAAYMQIDRNTLYRWAKENKIPGIKVGRKLFFYKGELDAWARGR